MAAEQQPPPQPQPPAERKVLRGGLLTDVVVPLAAATIAGPGTAVTAVVAHKVINRPAAEPKKEVIIPSGVETPD